jgi:hypothetical protein
MTVADVTSPLPSLMRLLRAEEPLVRENIVGFGWCLWVVAGNLGVGRWIRWLRLDTRDDSIQKWSEWFSEEVEGLKALSKKYDNNLAALCQGRGPSEPDARERLNAIGRVMGGWDPVLQRTLKRLFNSHGHCPYWERYAGLSALCAIPAAGLDVFERSWRIGHEFERRSEFDKYVGMLTPYRALDQLVQAVKEGSGAPIGEKLVTWCKKIDAKTPPNPLVFHQYLQAVLPLLPSYLNAKHWSQEEAIAQVELALSPNLKDLFQGKDQKHADLIESLVDGKPLTVGNRTFLCIGKIADECYRFSDEQGKKEVALRVSFVNPILLNLRFAESFQGGSHLRQPSCITIWGQGIALEVEEAKEIDWENPPKDLADQLGKLAEGMPANLQSALRMTGTGQACWVFKDDLVPFDAAVVEAFLHDCSSERAPTWMHKSGLLEKGADQREKVLSALDGNAQQLTDLERESLGELKALRKVRDWDKATIRQKLADSNCVLFVLPRHYK